MCEKDNTKIKFWPEDTPEECRLVPSRCPHIEPEIKRRCKRFNDPLEFFYDSSLLDYNFRKYATDHDIVQKVRTGKGDENMNKFKGSKNVIYTELFFGSTQPKKLRQDYINGDNDIISAKAI